MKGPLAGLVFDSYDRRARLAPALLVALPTALGVLAWFPTGFPGVGVLLMLSTWCGLTVLVANMGRDMGKKREPDLYARWGGMPTTQRLRHRGPKNRQLLDRRHRQLAALAAGSSAPTVEQERTDPNGADETYELWTHVLREKTRDKARFPLVHVENRNYGFRRNFWGMKPIGVASTLIGIGAAGGRLFGLRGRVEAGATDLPVVIVSGIVCVLFLLGWTFWFTPSWVRVAADAYADRLVAALEEL